MLLAETYVGHRDDPSVADRLAAANGDADGGTELHRAVLTDTERRRSRIRTETTDGLDLGVVAGRDLADGDVLEAENGSLIVVELAGVEALAITLGDGVSASAALALGHAVGNRHLDLAVRDGEALIPVADSRDRVEAIVDEHLPGATPRYETVPPTTFDDGGVSRGDHSHGDGDGGHAHAHDVDAHGHTHGDGRDHGDDSHAHGRIRSVDGDGP